MLAAAVARGERTPLRVWIGALAATAGVVLLVGPSVHAPPVAEACLMTIAGVGWGLYSIAARTAPPDAVAFTGMAFRRAALLAAPLTLLLGGARPGAVSGSGVVLAIASGAVASACGYVTWQRLAPRLGAARAAIVQLAVPFVTAGLGVVALGETFTLRHLLAGALTASGLVLGVRPASSRPVVQPYGERQP
jgi:drug/metabolite transporter (DMT)-like permease